MVTRYFGGVKLGAGGLVRAYGGAANDILAVVPTCKEERAVDISVKISYANFSAVTNILSVKALTVNNVSIRTLPSAQPLRLKICNKF